MQGTTAGQSTRVISYSYDPNTLLQTAERTRDGIFINDLAKDYLSDTAGTVTFDKTLATSYDNLLRVTGINVPNTTGNDYNLGYGYGAEGRLISITDQLNTKTFGYNYNPNSRNLIDEMTAPIHKVVNQYEANRGVLLSKTNSTTAAASTGIADISKFQYTVNSIGKRTKAILSGKSITENGLANTNLTWDYTYNDKGELATANATSDNPAVAAINRTFTFDAIGNRSGLTENGTSTSYVSNALNQYTSITKTLADNTTVTESKTHDADGNTTQDKDKKYTFDAEDRLTKVTDLNDAVLVSYRYDAYSRRIERTVPNGNKVQYLYNSWNVIAEYKEQSAGVWELTTTRTWGLDISGTEQGAGGIGGLLAENQITSSTTSSYYPLYDGNGNITEYLDATGAIVAHYEYDPFGKINRSTGSKAGDFRYQWSTKPVDTITGYHYYGYRWYDAENGRWINRDPIKEDGGLNVYNFCNGDPINHVDVLGLETKKQLDTMAAELEELRNNIIADWKKKGLSVPHWQWNETTSRGNGYYGYVGGSLEQRKTLTEIYKLRECAKNRSKRISCKADDHNDWVATGAALLLWMDGDAIMKNGQVNQWEIDDTDPKWDALLNNPSIGSFATDAVLTLSGVGALKYLKPGRILNRAKKLDKLPQIKPKPVNPTGSTYTERINATPKNGGKWKNADGTPGARGESYFHHTETKIVLRYKNGYPIYDRHAILTVDYDVVEATKYCKANGIDTRAYIHAELNAKYGEILGMPKTRFKKWLSENKLTWHEHENMKKIQLIPTEMNKRGHWGGIGEADRIVK